MSTGAYISGAGHLFLILWVVLGGVIFRADPVEIEETTDVRLLSETEYLSLTAGRPEPDSVQELDALQPPGIEENQTLTSTGDLPSEQAPRPEIATPVEPDPTPRAPDLSVPEAEVDTAVPDAPVAPVSDEMIALLPPELTPGRPQDAPRVAPTPVLETPPTAQEAPDFVAPTAPSVETAPEAPPEDTSTTAPPEATTEIVTEADQDQPRGASVTGFPPRLRPRDAVASEAPVEPATSTAVDAAPSGTDTASPVAEADPDLPVGPPLNFGEVNELVAAMEQCWRPGSLSTAAASSTVTVGVKMNPDGTPIVSSIRMIDGRGPDDRSVKTAYETAVRAVRRCGLSGFPLPSEKYAHWAEIEITFSPDEGLLFE